MSIGTMLGIIISLLVVLVVTVILSPRSTNIKIDATGAIEELRATAGQYANVLAVVNTVQQMENLTDEQLEQLRHYPAQLVHAAQLHLMSKLSQVIQVKSDHLARQLQNNSVNHSTITTLQADIDQLRAQLDALAKSTSSQH